MAEQKNYPLTVIGLMLFNVIVYLGVALLVMRPVPAGGITILAFAHFTGVVLSSLAVPGILTALAVIPEIPFTMAGMAKMRRLLLLLLPGLLLRIPGMEICFGNTCLDMAFHFAVGLMAPLIYTLFFKHVPFYQQGLCFGVSLATGLAAWQLFMLYPEVETGARASADRLLLAFQSQLIAVGLFIVVVLAAVSKERGPLLRAKERESGSLPGGGGERRRNIARLILAAGVFFLMNGMLEARLFSTRPPESESPIKWLLFVVIFLLPLIGRYVDIGKEQGFRTVIMACSFFFLLAPSLTDLEHAPLLYMAIRGLATTGQFTVLAIVPIYLAKITPFSSLSCLVYCSVYILRGMSVSGSWFIRNMGDIDDGLIILTSTLSTILFYILVRGVTFTDNGNVVPLSGFLLPAGETAPGEDGNSPVDAFSRTSGEKAGRREGDRAAPTPKNYAEIFENHNLSPREREVAAMLIGGASTRNIAEELRISEHTVKTHVKNILAKFNVPTRKAFMAMLIAGDGP